MSEKKLADLYKERCQPVVFDRELKFYRSVGEVIKSLLERADLCHATRAYLLLALNENEK